MTFDRTRALSREDLGFLTWDHPLIRGALDGLLGSEAGNTAFGVWRDGGRETILLETCFVAECVAPVALHADRFLPMTPVRVVVDHACADLSDDAEVAAAKLEKGDVFRLLDRGAVKKKLLPAMLEKARLIAAERLEKVVAAAVAKMTGQLSHEVQRLRDLAEINDHVRPAEIEATMRQQTDLQTALASAHLRLDAVRLVLRMP